MRKITSTEKTKMTVTQIESLNDTCVIHTPAFSQDTLGEQSATWTNSSSIDCGFNPAPSNKKYNEQTSILEWDAVLRLPLTQSININQEVTVRNIRYSIYGISTGNGVSVVTLKKVSNND